MPRRLIADLMHASIHVPFVSLRRPLNVRPLVEARGAAVRPPGWAAIFVKAFCLVAKDEPVLRTRCGRWAEKRPWVPVGFRYDVPNELKILGYRTQAKPAWLPDNQNRFWPQSG